MEDLSKEELIISLIQNNLINLKLIYGLEQLGLVPDDYYLDLGSTVFKLMGIQSSEQSDMLFENVFIANCKKIGEIDVRDRKGLVRQLSESIYKDLLFAKATTETKI